MDEWIGVDLDGTLAVWGEWEEPENGYIGRPVGPMMERVKQWMGEGKRVKLCTSRAQYPNQVPFVLAWLKKHGLEGMEMTHGKDCNMIQLWDDRCVTVERNTGRVLAMPTPD